MTEFEEKLSAVSHFLHRHLLKFIVLSYALAAVFAAPTASSK